MMPMETTNVRWPKDEQLADGKLGKLAKWESTLEKRFTRQAKEVRRLEQEVLDLQLEGAGLNKIVKAEEKRRQSEVIRWRSFVTLAKVRARLRTMQQT